jgi:hypothetical protein
MKKCSKCQVEKSLSEFKGKSYYCTPCNQEYRKQYRINNPSYMKEYFISNRDKITIKEKEWRENNKDRFNTYHNGYHKERRKNPLHKLHKFIASGIYRGIKFGSKDTTSLEILGLNSWEEFKIYLENQFVENMSWNNYGKGNNNNTWHIDHIIPISSATTLEEIKKLNYYTNLKPMWCSDNIRKSNKLL